MVIIKTALPVKNFFERFSEKEEMLLFKSDAVESLRNGLEFLVAELIFNCHSIENRLYRFLIKIGYCQL
jgi:hypothetical protein